MPVNPTVFTPEPITTTPQVYVDGEDLIITTENSNEVVKLSDRVATTTESIKQGYKRVRQDAVLNTAYFQANTTYEFIYHHDLDDETITFPEGVILNFNGGKLDNGTLIGNHTAIVAPITLIFKRDLKIHKDGTWNIDRAYSDWFECYKNGYYIDPVTFDPTAQTYDFNGTTGITMGTPCGAMGDNDRHTLQQLLNLEARHTIISEGMYMVDALGGNGVNPNNQLTWAGKKGLTLQIDGILKLIPNSLTNYAILVIADCDNVKLCGSGKLVGDLPEHSNEGGEWGMCLQVFDTANMALEDLTLEQGWGDGVYYSWNSPYPNSPDMNNQVNHYWSNVKCLYNRRTGFAVEKGDDLVITGSTFSNNGHWRRINILGTFSGADIEPFEADEVFQRYCSNLTFRSCIFENNFKAGLRAERCVGLIIDGNRFENNNEDIDLLQCDFGSYNIVPNISNNRKYVAGCANVINNQSRNSRTFINADYNPSRAIIENNYLQNTHAPFSGMWIDTVFRNNKVYNSSNIMNCWGVIKNVTVESNEFHHVSLEFEDQNYQSAQMITLPFSGEGEQTAYDRYDYQVSNFIFKNNVIKDYSLQKLNGSGANGTNVNGNPPLPYSKLKQFFIRVNTNLITDKIVFRNNIMPRERFFTDGIINASGTHDDRIHFYNEIDVNTDRLWLKGDYFYDETYYQDAVVVQAGRTAPYSDWGIFTPVPPAPPYSIPGGQIIFDPSINLGKPILTTRPAAENLDITGGDAPWIWMNPPVVHWKTIGRCTSTTRPLAFNTLGRRLIETDTGDMIMWDGTAWVVV